MTERTVSRRALLGGGIAAAGVLPGVPLLSGCASNGGGSQGIGGVSSADVTLPEYVRYQGGTPDILGTELVPDLYVGYPAAPAPALSEKPCDGSPITGSVPSFAPIPPPVGDNAYWQALNERLGSPLQHSIVPAADYPARFATMAAGGTLGDIFNIDESLSDLPAFMESECADLTEYLAGDAVREYPFLANIPTASWEGVVFNGRINALPIVRGTVLTQTLFTRNDIFADRGVEPRFDSLETFTAVCAELTDARNGLWALSFVPDIILLQMLGVTNDWVVEGGAFSNAIELEQYKDMLEVGRKLIADGLVHPDSVGADTVDLKNWFAAETSAAMMQDTYTAIPGFFTRNVSDEDFELGVSVIPGPEGQPAPVWQGLPNIAMTAIKKADPERVKMLLRFANFLAAPFGTEESMFVTYGLEGQHYTLEGTDPVRTEQGRTETVLLVNYLCGAPGPIYVPDQTEGAAAAQAEMARVQHDHMLQTMPNSTLTPTWGLYSPTHKSETGRLERVLTDAANSVLLGREPVSSWDGVVAGWRADGGDDIKAEYGEALEARDS